MVQTKHPLGKNNKPVKRENYELFKNTIIAVLREREPTHTGLVDELESRLAGFDGNIDWHAMTIKLDLEARGVIERTATTPQRYRLA